MSDTTTLAKTHQPLHQPIERSCPGTIQPGSGTFLVFLMLFLLLFPGPAAATGATAGNESPLSLITSLQKKYRTVSSLQFDFHQVTHSSGRERAGQGNAVFLRPQQVASSRNQDLPGAVIRWNYTAPVPQVILNDGRELSIYNIKERQLIITPAKEVNADITYAFFAGTRDLLDDFTAMAPDPRFAFSLADRTLRSVRLVPKKPDAQVKTIQIWVDNDLLIHHLVIEDYFDSITELTFTNIRLNSVNIKDPAQLRRIIDLQLQPGTEIITR